MMKADYDSQGKTLQITVQQVERADYGVGIGEPLAAAVAVANDRAVGIDILEPGPGMEKTLEEIARRFDLDLEELMAVAQAALAAPDRPVLLDVGDRQAA